MILQEKIKSKWYGNSHAENLRTISLNAGLKRQKNVIMGNNMLRKNVRKITNKIVYGQQNNRYILLHIELINKSRI